MPGFISAVVMLAIATVLFIFILLQPAPSSPAACSHPSLPSGDVYKSSGHYVVCTDGVWVTLP
jgi:hypothetical protein